MMHLIQVRGDVLYFSITETDSLTQSSGDRKPIWSWAMFMPTKSEVYCWDGLIHGPKKVGPYFKKITHYEFWLLRFGCGFKTHIYFLNISKTVIPLDPLAFAVATSWLARSRPRTKMRLGRQEIIQQRCQKIGKKVDFMWCERLRGNLT